MAVRAAHGDVPGAAIRIGRCLMEPPGNRAW